MASGPTGGNELKVGTVVVALIALKEKAVGGAVGIEALDKGLGITDNVLGLADDVKTFAHQLVEERDAVRAAHPDVVRVENDLLDVMSSGAKLASDMRRLVGT